MGRAAFPRVTLPQSAGTNRRPLATTPDLAEHYGVPVKTIRYWHQTQTCIGPLMFRVGKHLRARWDDIEAYDAEQAGGRNAA